VTDIADLVGERLTIGLPGPTLSDADIRLFRDTRAAGLILYRRNFETPEALATMLDRLDDALGRRVLVSTDHEGGRIVMIGRGTTIFPDNLAVGTAGEEAFAARQGLIEAREMRRLGVDLTLGPCLDVLTDRYSPNIGIRSYGKDPKVVSRYGVARIRGQMRGGLSACPKHFPGKGHSPLDAHLKLPTIDSTLEEMQEFHLPPFREAIAAGVECLMTSHPVYPRLDPSGVPSRKQRCVDGDPGCDRDPTPGTCSFAFWICVAGDDPRLGCVGDHVASGRGGFAFSDALKSKGGTWDWQNLSDWLKSPKTYAPGTKMTFAGLSKPEDRANVIAYLNKQSEAPKPMPAAPAEAAPATGADKDAAPAGDKTADAGNGATPAKEADGAAPAKK